MSTPDNLMVTVVQPDEQQPLLSKRHSAAFVDDYCYDNDDKHRGDGGSSALHEKQQPQQQPQQQQQTSSCSLQSLRNRFVEMFPVSTQLAVQKTLSILSFLVKAAFVLTFGLLFIAIKLVFVILNSSIFAALFAVALTFGGLSFLATVHVIPTIIHHPALTHARFLANNFIYPAYSTQAWSILTEQPALCLASDQSSRVMNPEDFITGTQMVPLLQSSTSPNPLLSHLAIRAGGQMRSNIVFKTTPVISDYATIEYSIAHSDTDKVSFVHHKAAAPSESRRGEHLFWLDAGSKENFSRRGWYSREKLACAYANITVTIPEHIREGVKVFVAATKPNVVVEKSAEQFIGSIRVIEPIQRKLSDRTIEDN
ncbi:hypothetical protein GQ42DRAFT_163244 [Ramicandelaber brevisporus]|nr:hypothetical protein GQ42DRAFT_163244 [Ramicandelaber brevisporus]